MRFYMIVGRKFITKEKVVAVYKLNDERRIEKTLGELTMTQEEYNDFYEIFKDVVTIEELT
jgi:hypothetical protein